MPRPSWDDLAPDDLVWIETPEGGRYWVRVVEGPRPGDPSGQMVVAAATVTSDSNLGTYTIARGRDEPVILMSKFFEGDPLR